MYDLKDPDKPNRKLARVKSHEHKIFLLISAALSDGDVLSSVEYSMRQEAEECLRTGRRIAACMEQAYSHQVNTQLYLNSSCEEVFG